MTEEQKMAPEPADANPPVLAATDFSAPSRAALLWAADYAASCGAPLIVLHAVHDPAHDPGHYREDDDNWSETMPALAQRKLDAFMDEMVRQHPGHAALADATVLLVNGLPAGRIVELAQREGARLVAVGSCGRTGLQHALLGSVAEEVVQHAPMPVTVVKQPEPDE